jgi:hypothetical protein
MMVVVKSRFELEPQTTRKQGLVYVTLFKKKIGLVVMIAMVLDKERAKL